MSRSTVWLFVVVFNTFEKKDPKETLKTPPPGPDQTTCVRLLRITSQLRLRDNQPNAKPKAISKHRFHALSLSIICHLRQGIR